MRKIQKNKLHAKLDHPIEDRMCATAKHTNCGVKGVIEVGEDCDVAENNQQLLRKLSEDQYLNPGKITYF